MELIESPIALALEIWKDGTFVTTTLEEKRKSLYLFQGKHYVLYYTEDNRLEKVEIIGKARIRKLFNGSVRHRNKEVPVQ